MVARVFSLLYREVRGMHQAAYILALFTLASQILAIVRDRTLAHQFGVGEVLDVYYAAFRIPDLLYVVFASVLSVYVLLPFVSKAYAKTDSAAREILSQVFSVFLWAYVFSALVVWVVAPVIVPFLFPGFSTSMHAEIVPVLRLLLLQPLFLGLSSLASVVTQMQHRFIVFALSPLLYNVGIIIGAIWGYEWWGLPGLALGVVFGAVGHLIIQLPLLSRSNLFPHLLWRIDWGLMRTIGATAFPRAMALSLSQIQFMFFVFLGSFMTVGSVSVLQFAHNLQSVPLAIIGSSYSVAAFPTLITLLASEKRDEFEQHVMAAIRHILFWTVPVVALVIVLRAHIVRLILGSGEFDWDATRLTAAVLAIFILALAVQSILFLLIRAFYAGGKATWPLILTGAGTMVGCVSAFIGYELLTTHVGSQVFIAQVLRLSDVAGVEVLAIPLGFVLGSTAQLAVTIIVFAREFSVSFTSLSRPLTVSLVAAAAAGSAAYGALHFIVEGINQERYVGILLQGAVAAAVGIIATVVVHYFLRSAELAEVYTALHRRIISRNNVVVPQDEEIHP